MIKVSDYIFDFLKSKNIDTIFSVAGGAAAHLLNSVSNKGFKYICNYHEQSCAMAAEGYARIANKPACVLVTNGPGSTNTITGVLGAYQDSIPMLIISGQVPTKQSMGNTSDNGLRQLGVQECDIISMVKSITKYAVQITDANTIPYHIAMAYKAAITGRKGPVWLDIPLDIQSAYIDANDFVPNDICIDNEYSIKTVIDIIFKSKRPLIVTGNGIHLSQTENYFNLLKNKLKIPIVSTWTSKDLLNQSDSLYVGTFGILGERAGNFAIQNADVLLILGSRLSIPNIGYISDTFSPKSVKIMVDIDVNELNKPNIKIDYKIEDDLINFFPKILNELQNNSIPDWSNWCAKTQDWKEKYPVFQTQYSLNKERINSFYFTHVLSTKLTENHVIVTDMGTSYTCTMQSLHLNGTTRLFTSSATCSMGFGLPGAIGAYFADPTKDIILIVGDGGMQMNIQELQTINHHKIPIKIFLLNNNGYLAISLMQDNLFNGNYVGANTESGVSNPDFVKIAKVYNLKTYCINNNTELQTQIDYVLKEEGPVFCEIKMTENQPLIPRVQSMKDENGNIISNSLENMYPFLNDDELKNIMK